MKVILSFFLMNIVLFSQHDVWTNYNSSNSPLGQNWVSSIAIDLDGSKWFATYEGGLAKLDSTEWTIYDTTVSFLPHNLVWTVQVDSSNKKWIGCGAYGGLVKYDGINKTLYDTSSSGLPDNMVHSITFEDSNYIWIGTLQGGVARFDGEDEWIVYNEENSGLPGDFVLCVTIDSEGNKWIGTHDDGLTVFDGYNWTVYNTDNSPLPDNEVIDIAIDSLDNKWIAMEGGGLAKFDGTNWELFNTENSGLKSDDLIFAEFDVNGNIWLGTTFGGLSVYNGKSWKHFDNINTGLGDENALSIAFDANGDAWIGTWMGGVTLFKNGVQRVNLNEEPVPYYPLEFGNRWDYSVTNSDSISISVVGDTTMYNGITYFALSQQFGAGQYLRADNDYVYYYDESDSMDTPVYNFNAPLDEWYNIGLYTSENDSPRVMLSQIDTVSIFDYETRLLTFDLDWLNSFALSLSDKFGPAYLYITPNEPISYSLLGCIISDTTYPITPPEFFPLHIGNHWQYSENGVVVIESRAVSDTTMSNSKTYTKISGSHSGYYRKDGSKVYSYNPSTNEEKLKYDFSSDEGDTLSVEVSDEDTLIIRVSSIGYTEIFGETRKYFNYMYEWVNSSEGFEKRFIDGLGFSQQYGLLSYGLTGAVIDGQQYGTIVNVEKNNESIPTKYSLKQNYPNPFNPETVISYQLPVMSKVELKVYDVLGREVATLVNKEQSAGTYEVQFDASNLTSGIYFYRLMSGEYSETKKMLILK